jgi:hypothetical protein
MDAPGNKKRQAGTRAGAGPSGAAESGSFAQLQAGTRAVLADALEKAAAQQPARQAAGCGAASAKAGELEGAVLAEATRQAGQGPGLLVRRVYARLADDVRRALPVQAGPYPDDILALLFLGGQVGAAEAVVRAQGAAAPDPREQMRRLFVRTLMQAAPAFARDRHFALEAARGLETSCYNAAIQASKESEDPPRRQWDSGGFVEIYSARCGTLAVHLDPQSSVGRAYPGARLAERLLAHYVPTAGLEPLRPDRAGEMTEKELCPQAVEAERAEIAKRASQKVTEKESSLFRCPHCGVSRCTYRVQQRRCLDEAPSYPCQCLACGRRFEGR